jgi:squalene-hopene/tetraprenyl-beta-curcumene cyclase
MKTPIVSLLVAVALPVSAFAAEPSPGKPAAKQSTPAKQRAAAATDSTQTKSVAVAKPAADAPAKPVKIAHGGCYYPFPIEANDPDEPLAKEFSLRRGTEYLDGLTLDWTREAGCVTCHTTLPYFAARAADDRPSSGPAVDELLALMEYRVAHWQTEKPLWDAEVLITAVSMLVHDAQATGKLKPSTRTALDRMWELQRADGAWNWLKAGTPPFEYDDYYGAVLVAVGLGYAPEKYSEDPEVQKRTAKLRDYFAKKPPPNLHHAAWLIWAEAKFGGVMTDEARDRKVAELSALQKPDGGWSLPSLGNWKGHDGLPIDQAPSDGYATGLVVFALRQAGLPADHAAVAKGIKWLKANQRASGSWYTGSLGTRYHLNFLSHSGSALAMMALRACP